MKSIILPVLIAGLGAGMLDAAEPKKAPALNTDSQKFNYVLGLNVGNMLSRDGLEIKNPEQFLLGLQDAFSRNNPKLPVSDLQKIFQTGLEAARAKQQAKQAQAGAAAKKTGEDFLAANKKKPGVKTTASGLQYVVLKQGTGKTPKSTDTVVAHYTGTLIDGTKFDSSVDRGQPLTIRANQVIKGWTEALTMMQEGAKWKVFIPWNIAYGERGSPPKIPPYAALIFEMELLKIQ